MSGGGPGSGIRVVSLIASATEIVCAIGGRDRLVGVSHECDFPADVAGLPVCSHAKLDASRPSAEIDADVKRLLADAVSIYGLQHETIDRLGTTHLITQSKCDVCAVSLKDVQAAVCETLACKPEIVVCEPHTLADVWDDIRRVGVAIELAGRAEALIAASKKRLGAIEKPAEPPRVACIEWTQPLMAAGNWVPELVEIAGGRNVLGRAGEHSPWLSAEELSAAEPDVIVVMPCGFGLERTVRESAQLPEVPGWSDLPAVRAGRVFAVDGNAYFNRPGPRLVESAELLAELFAGPPGDGDGVRWRRL